MIPKSAASVFLASLQRFAQRAVSAIEVSISDRVAGSLMHSSRHIMIVEPKFS